MTRVVFLGRFQPFHKGHARVIEKRNDDDFAVAVGSAEKSREEENPLSFEERKEIIRECFPELEVIEVQDTEKTPKGNRIWAEKLEEETGADTIISGNELVQRLVREHTSMEVKQPELHDPDIYSGTEIRRRIRSGEEWRYLVPECAEKKLETFLEEIRDSGIKYEFNPGWKKENSSHGTS